MTIDEGVQKLERDIRAHIVKVQDSQLLLMIESGRTAEYVDEFLHEQRAQFEAEMPRVLAQVRECLMTLIEPCS